jgi:ribosome biogenesis protein BMS1
MEFTDFQTITRTTRRFNTLKVPRKLEASLPYASKTKHIAPQRKETYMQSRAVVLEPEEKKAIALMQQIQALRKDKVARRKDKQEERRAEHRKEKGVIDEKKEAKAKEERREKYRKEGIKRKREEQGGKGGGDKRSKA